MKKLRVYQLYIFLALTAVLLSQSACEDPVDLDLGEARPELVVDAVIKNTTDSQFIFLNKSIGYLNQGTYPGYQADSVMLIDSTGGTITKHIFTYAGNGKYFFVPPSANTFQTGNSYGLYILDGANTYYSVSQLNRVSAIDSFTCKFEEKAFGQKEGNYVELYSDDIAGPGDFYWLKLFRNDSFQGKASQINLSQDGAFVGSTANDGKRFIPPIAKLSLNDGNRPYKTGEKVRIEILSINPEMYYYLNEIVTQLNNQGLFATPPANVRGNIFCQNDPKKQVLGFFSMCNVSKAEVLVP